MDYFSAFAPSNLISCCHLATLNLAIVLLCAHSQPLMLARNRGPAFAPFPTESDNLTI